MMNTEFERNPKFSKYLQDLKNKILQNILKNKKLNDLCYNISEDPQILAEVISESISEAIGSFHDLNAEVMDLIINNFNNNFHKFVKKQQFEELENRVTKIENRITNLTKEVDHIDTMMPRNF